MAGESFAQFLADLAIEYYQKPKEERERLKEERLSQPPNPYSHKWFGFLPSTIKLLKKSLLDHKSKNKTKKYKTGHH